MRVTNEARAQKAWARKGTAYPRAAWKAGFIVGHRAGYLSRNQKKKR